MKSEQRVEKFDYHDLGALSIMLMQDELDSSQASELLATFLNGRGYGVNGHLVQEAVLRMDEGECDPACMQAELERVALVM